jgi:fucose permease
MVLIGIGIGGAVTATNLIFGNEYPEIRGRLLTRTNFFWGVGAVTAPQLVAIAERHHALRVFLLSIAAATLLVSVVFTPLIKASSATRFQESRPSHEQSNLKILALFSAMLFLYVGCETAIAGWIATYMHRVESFSMARSSLVVSIFWLALVGGRALSPLLLRFYLELTVLLGSIVFAVAGISFFLTKHSIPITLTAVIIAGLGCASIFPLVTSRLLARVGRSRRTGWIFAICGSGGAVIPWLTGLLSQHSGSLRVAFSVPLLGLAAIFFCVLWENAKSLQASP